MVGALIWGWPAYSFILAAGGMVAVVKRGASRDDGSQETGTVPDTAPDTPARPAPDIGMDMQQDKPTARSTDKPQVAPRTARRTVTGLDRAADIIRRNPGFSNAEVAKRARVSEKTVSRARAAGVKTQE